MNLNTQKRAVVIFTRAPQNETKRIAAPHLACTLHTALILQTLRTVASAPNRADIVLAVDGVLPRVVQDLVDGLRARDQIIHVTPQVGHTFESRFLGALHHAFGLGYKRIVAVGTDTPTLHSDDIHRSLDSQSVVIGPAVDGGFYLIGLNVDDVDTLSNLPWHGADLCKQLKQRNEAWLLPRRADVDSADDARKLWSLLATLTYDLLDLDVNSTPILCSPAPDQPGAAFSRVTSSRGPPIVA